MLQSKLIYLGDNLKKLPELPRESADLIYIDPPFNSGAEYEIFWESPEERPSFDDRFGHIEKYISWMRPRLAELTRVLSSRGSIFVHCDPHANYAIRAVLQDELKLRFQSEIVWKRSSAHSGAQRPGPVHDTIYFFSKTDEHTWNQIYQPLPQETIEAWYNNVEPETGRRFNRANITAAGTRAGPSGRPWRGIDPSRTGRHWAIPGFLRHIVKDLDAQAALDALDAAGRIFWPKKAGGQPMLKRYVEESRGVPLGDVWNDIPPIHMQGKERVGYPTQKPVALLERIVLMASNPGDLVLDAFCGCGTALVAAERLKRRWVGIDQSPTACRVVADRLRRDCYLREGVEFFVRSVLDDEEALRRMHPSDFENWAVTAVGGLPNQIKVGDKGIDGRLYVAGRNVPRQVQKEFVFEHQLELDFIPIQAKQKDKVGRPDVDAFETAMRREKKTFGIIIAFDFTRDAKDEIRRAKREEGLTILAMPVREILERQAA